MNFIDVDQVQQYFAETADIETKLVQLSSGPLDLHVTDFKLEGVTLLCTRSSSQSHWQDVKRSRDLHFGYVVDAQGPMLSCGKDFSGDRAQVWFADQEVDLILRGSFVGLEICIAADLVEELGWRICGPAIKRIDRDASKRLVRTCMRLLNSQHHRPRLAETIPFESHLLCSRDNVLSELEVVLEPWLMSDSEEEASCSRMARYFGTVTQARLIFESFDFDARLEIDSLAASLGVSRATLFRSFRQMLGLSPQQYFRIRRLHEVRSALQKATKDSTTVTQIATTCGFSEMSRFAAYYQQQFGEYPSQTLTRSGMH